MKKFSFSLQRLLDIKESREKDIRYELAAVVGRQNRLRIRQEGIRASMKDASASGSVITDNVLAYGRFMDVSLRAIDDAEQRINLIQPEVDEVKQRLVEAMREKKVLERLKEKKIEEFNYLLNREEFGENDDMNQKIYSGRVLPGEYE